MPALLSAVSCYSLMRGVQFPSALCSAARRYGYDAIALTDRNNLYGLPDFLIHCERNGLRPVIAAELTQDDCSALVYAHGDRGYANLCRLISARHCDKEFKLVDALHGCPEGLHVVTADTGLLEALRDALPVYFRMTSPRRPPDSVKKQDIPCLIIPRTAFLDHSDFLTHRLLRAIDCNTTLSRLDSSECMDPNALMRPWGNIRERFGMFERALDDTERFAESIRSRTDFGAPLMPAFLSEKPALQVLREKALRGAAWRYPVITPAVTERLNYELDLIGRKGFAPYFLVVHDIVKQSTRTCGRGSGAASIVNYCLGITNVDPIRYNLIFERFINTGRVDPPDIDIDFAWDERDKVLDYIFSKYGEEHAAMIAVHQTFGLRMALREVGRVYGYTESEISAVTKKIPHFFEMDTAGADIEAALSLHPRTSHIPLDPPWPEIIRYAQRIFGLPFGIGTHCGGVAITARQVRACAPVQISAKGYPIVQWEKDGAEQMGLVKIDCLGNRSLAVIRDALDELRRWGMAPDERQWDPASDPAAIRLLAAGRTMGVFYVESPAMRLLQQKTGKGDFEHMVIHSSIIRPAANKYINEYIRRLKGGAYEIEHPCLRKLLSETNGIMVYQEDVAKVAMAVAGFSFEEADALRKIISKKDRYGKLRDFRERFFSGAAKRGVTRAVAGRLWDMCMSFAGYSFCKPHSASYVQVSFQSAWLKAHYPAAFLAAVMSNYGGFYVTQAYVSEAQRLGIAVLGPDVNESGERYSTEMKRSTRQPSADNDAPQSTCEMAIRVGLCQIKGLGERIRGEIIGERERGGRYAGLHDFLSRAHITEADAERLILAGACDSLEPSLSRSQLFWKMRCFFRGNASADPPLLKPWTRLQTLRAQYLMLGYLTECHPLQLMRLPRLAGAVKIAALASRIGGRAVFFGWCITSKTVATSQNEPMQFVTFEDETATCECVLFPEAYRRFVRYLGWKEAFAVRGTVQEEYGAVTVIVDSIEPVRGTERSAGSAQAIPPRFCAGSSGMKSGR